MLTQVLSIIALVLVTGVLIVVVKIGKALKNGHKGHTLHWLTLAFVYAVGVRAMIVANAFGWTHINTNWTGTPLYVLLLIGFLVLYRNLIAILNHESLSQNTKNWFKRLVRW